MSGRPERIQRILLKISGESLTNRGELGIHPDEIATIAEHDMVLEENMVFNIDMPYFEHGWGTLHIEDTVRVTANGFEPLTSLDTSLRIVS